MNLDLILHELESVLDDALAAWQADLSLLISQESVRDLSTADRNAPFGSGIRGAFNVFAEIAKRLGYTVYDYAGYAIDARFETQNNCSGLTGLRTSDKTEHLNSTEEKYVAVLGHLDIVSAGENSAWKSDPFILTERDGYIYGRGVNDDKGPLLLCLYAGYLLRKIGCQFDFPLRIIAGGAEETTWECMDYYFRQNTQPFAGFTPDGNFPIINHELGILNIALNFPALQDFYINVNDENNKAQNVLVKRILSKPPEHKVCSDIEMAFQPKYKKEFLTVKLQGKAALSRNPGRGVNAIDLLIEYIEEHSDMDLTDEQCQDTNDIELLKFYRKFCYAEKGKTSQALLKLTPNDTAAKYDKKLFSQAATAMEYDSEKGRLYLDLRYPDGFDVDTFLSQLESELQVYHATLTIEKHLKPLYVEPTSPLIRKLSGAYEKVIGSPIGELGAKGAASYARVLNNGVNFGPTFFDENPGSHFPNEHLSLNSARKLLKIYALSIAQLVNAEAQYTEAEF